MEKKCYGCNRTIGMFSGENYILPDSAHCMCDKCYSPLRIAVNKMKAKDSIEELEYAYDEAVKSVRQSTIADKTTIVLEVEQLYLKRHAELEYTQEKMEQEANRLAKEKEEEERQSKLRAYIADHYNEISNHFLMTTGNDFSGYEIIEYLGIVSEGVVQGTGWLSELSADFNDLFGTESNTFAQKMEICREAALERAKNTAIRKGANALVSVDFETTTFRNNMIGIMVAGTAVRVRKLGNNECDK